MGSIKEVLMRRDGMSKEDADKHIQEARRCLMVALEEDQYIDDAEFMEDWFGLEPDYFIELL